MKDIINNMQQYINIRESHLMHAFYGILTSTTWLDYEEVRIQIQKYLMKTQYKTKRNRIF